VRYLNDVFLRSGDDALSVKWFEITVVNAKTGEQLYHNSCLTNHRLTADNVREATGLKRDSLVSVMYSEELDSSKSSVTLQRTDRHGILGQKPSDFQLSL
jgi:hypothetical protein